jgi:hypothetical protein
MSNDHEIKEMMDVVILPPGTTKPIVVDRIEVTLYYDDLFEDFNLTEESDKEMERIRVYHLNKLKKES